MCVFQPNHCNQCHCDAANFENDSRRAGDYEINCRSCGHHESHHLDYDEEGNYSGYTHMMRKGFGLLFFRAVGGHEFYSHSLNTPKEVLDSERWLRQRLRTGAVDAATASLSRWNDEMGQVEPVLGERVDLLAGRIVRRSGVPGDAEHCNQGDLRLTKGIFND
jgi:hypothetical protein